jgi:hypothetical protein
VGVILGNTPGLGEEPLSAFHISLQRKKVNPADAQKKGPSKFLEGG